jgi:DNA-binding NtrC family response regulator
MGDPAHILVVDDDQVASDLFRETLVGEGYKVTTAPDGLRALSSIRENSFHLVITDLEMPGLNGMALLTEAKRLKPHLLIILTTALCDEQVVNEAVSRGAYVVMAKPWGQEDMIKIIKTVLDHRQVHPVLTRPWRPVSRKKGAT